MKKRTFTILALTLVSILTLSLLGCEYSRDNSDRWKNKFDIASPILTDAGTSQSTANASGWYSTLIDDFDRDSLGAIWGTSNHGLRREEYWCDKMVTLKDGKVEVLAEQRDTHICETCPTSGLFTSGIQTTKLIDGKMKPTFEQAFGYYEATVQFPNSGGMWSAFWLQSDSMKQIGNRGKDGSEIDIYESSFWKNKTKVGHCIHYDGYGKKHKAGDTIRDTKVNLYSGYHTFALKWTPNEYVFYVDGVATWATDFGEISRVPAFLRLTNEIRPDNMGPYGQSLGDFTGGVFKIEQVRVFQNTNYINEIKSLDDFT